MATRTSKPADIARAEQAIAHAAEAYPEVIEEGPWGHRAFKIRGKAFLFMATDGGQLSFSVKLPISGKAALSHSFAQPTGYGLGKSGWVTATFASGDDIPLPTIVSWLDESFRTIAPKKLSAALSAPSISSSKTSKPALRAKKRATAPSKERAAVPAKKRAATKKRAKVMG
ncbi:MAG: MmcQ/YjbR family DNA-binding protein [Myxococcota bacterium]